MYHLARQIDFSFAHTDRVSFYHRGGPGTHCVAQVCSGFMDFFFFIDNHLHLSYSTQLFFSLDLKEVPFTNHVMLLLFPFFSGFLLLHPLQLSAA